MNKLYGSYRNGAIRRKHEFSLSENYFQEIISNDCFYCGSKPSNILKNKGAYGEVVYNGVDRFNNNLGYIPENCVPCCKTCNNAKGSMSGEEFVEWLARFNGRITDLQEYVSGDRPQGLVTVSGIVDKNGDKVSIQSAVDAGMLTGVEPAPAGWDVPREEACFSSKPFNLFLDQGRQLLTYCFGFRSPISDYTCQRYGVGTGITTPATTDVTLESPITLSSVGGITAPILGVDFLSPFVVRISYNIAIGDANGYLITERGLFSGNGTLFARHVSSAGINKTSDFSPTLTWRLRF